MNNQNVDWSLVNQAVGMAKQSFGVAPSREKMFSILMSEGAVDKHGMPTKFAMDNNLVDTGPKAE